MAKRSKQKPEERSRLWQLIQKIADVKNYLRGELLWHSPKHFPESAPDAPEISKTVLLYDKEFDMHGLGWYNFDKCKWNAFEEFYLENDFVWTYAPVP